MNVQQLSVPAGEASLPAMAELACSAFCLGMQAGVGIGVLQVRCCL